MSLVFPLVKLALPLFSRSRAPMGVGLRSEGFGAAGVKSVKSVQSCSGVQGFFERLRKL